MCDGADWYSVWAKCSGSGRRGGIGSRPGKRYKWGLHRIAELGWGRKAVKAGCSTEEAMECMAVVTVLWTQDTKWSSFDFNFPCNPHINSWSLFVNYFNPSSTRMKHFCRGSLSVPPQLDVHALFKTMRGLSLSSGERSGWGGVRGKEWEERREGKLWSICKLKHVN